MLRSPAVRGALLEKFFADEAYWAGQWMEDEVFEVGGRLLSATKFHPTDAVRIVDGYVEKPGQGREPLAEFFNQWLALQSATFVVTVGPSRKEELAALLSQHGFAFEMTPEGQTPT